MASRFVQESNVGCHSISPFLNPIQVVLNGNRVFSRNVIETSWTPPSLAASPSVFNQFQPTVSTPFPNPRDSNLTHEHSWMTDSIRNALQERNKLFLQAKETNDPAVWKQYNILKEKINKDISQVKSKPSYSAQKFRSNNSWMTDSIRNALQERNKLFLQAKETNDPAVWKQYIILKDKINQDIIQAKSKPSYNAQKFRSNNNYRFNKKEKELPFSCDTCDRGFATETELKAHIDLHVKCHYTGCNFEAHPKIITLHKRMQHDTGYAGIINKLQNDEDIEKWREERRKRFPTAENILKRKAEQVEKEARGEIVEEKDFGRFKKQKFERRSWKENRFNRNKRNHRKSRHQRNDSRFNEGQSESEEEFHIKLPRFLGMNIKDDNSTNIEDENTEEALIDIPNSEAPVKETNEIDSAPQPEVIVLNDSDDEAAMEIPITKDPSDESSEESDDDQSHNEIKTPVKESNGIGNQSSDVKAIEEGKQSSIENQSPEMSVDDTCSGVKETKETASNVQNNKSNDGSEKKNHVERYPGKKIQEREQSSCKKVSLLEMLLDNEVRHERNVIMQCVRHIIRNSFFGIGEDFKKRKLDISFNSVEPLKAYCRV